MDDNVVRSLQSDLRKVKEKFPITDGPNADYLDSIISGKVSLPNGAERFVPIINWEHPTFDNFFDFQWHGDFRQQYKKEHYFKAVFKAMQMYEWRLQGRFQNELQGQMYFERSQRSIDFWEQLKVSQGNPEILIVPIQFGALHQDFIVDETIFSENECGLDLFSVLIIMITTGYHVGSSDTLAIVCSENKCKCTAVNSYYVRFIDAFGASQLDVNTYIEAVFQSVKPQHAKGGIPSGFLIK